MNAGIHNGRPENRYLRLTNLRLQLAIIVQWKTGPEHPNYQSMFEEMNSIGSYFENAKVSVSQNSSLDNQQPSTTRWKFHCRTS